jgi:hypothetical protein
MKETPVKARRKFDETLTILAGRATWAERERWRGELQKDLQEGAKALANARTVLNQVNRRKDWKMRRALTIRKRRAGILSIGKMGAGMSHMAAWELAKTTHLDVFERIEEKS